MAIRLHSFIAFLFLSVFLAGNSTVSSIPTQELDAMLSIVRARGYNLFSNAITTSDLQLDLLSAADNASFTFFAPIDSSLFALAMAESASAYTATLRYHGLPRRLSVSDLIRLPSQVPIRTLLNSQYVSVSRRLRGSRFEAISVNGVEVLQPELFFGPHVAVHGLGGILILNSENDFLYDSVPPLPPFRSGSPASNPKENTDLSVPPVSPPSRSDSPGGSPPPIDRGDSKEIRDFSLPPPDNSIGLSVSPSIRSGNPGSSPPQIDRVPEENRDFTVPPVSPPLRSTISGSFPPQIDRGNFKQNVDFSVPPADRSIGLSVSPSIHSSSSGSFPPRIDLGNSEEKRDLTVPPADRSIGISSVSPPFHSGTPASFPPQIDRGSKENGDLVVPPQIDRGFKMNRDSTVPPAYNSIGLSSVSPPIHPSTSNRAFLDPAPDRSHFHVQSPAISSISAPSASPVFTPAANPAIQNENAPTPVIGSAAAGDAKGRMESRDDLSGRTVDDYGPLDWV